MEADSASNCNLNLVSCHSARDVGIDLHATGGGGAVGIKRAFVLICECRKH